MALLLAFLHLRLSVLPPQPPLFSWATVPVFMHSGNGTGPISNSTAQFMSRFPLATMAGFQGDHHGGINEDHIGAFSRSVKAFNVSTRVLYYQNTLINFPQTRLGQVNATLPTSLLLHDKSGNLVYLGGCGSKHAAPNHTIFDHTQSAMRKAWVNNIVDVVRENQGLVDGVFCDRSGPIQAVLAKDLFCYEFEQGFENKWDEGHWQVVADTQAAISPLTPTAIVVGNHAAPEASMHLKNGSTWNAKMYEHFTPIKPATADYSPDGDQLKALMQNTNNTVVEVHVDGCTYDNDVYAGSLAAFLVGANEYDYYACTKGWGFREGWSEWSSDYDRALGEPLGPAVQSAGPSGDTVWHRRFASGTEVWLSTADQQDLKWGSSCIKWSDGHVTKSGDSEVCTANLSTSRTL